MTNTQSIFTEKNQVNVQALYAKFSQLEHTYLNPIGSTAVKVPIEVINQTEDVVEGINKLLPDGIDRIRLPRRGAEMVDIALETAYHGGKVEQQVILPYEFQICSLSVKVAYAQHVAGGLAREALHQVVRNSMILMVLVGRENRKRDENATVTGI